MAILVQSDILCAYGRSCRINKLGLKMWNFSKWCKDSEDGFDQKVLSSNLLKILRILHHLLLPKFLLWYSFPKEMPVVYIRHEQFVLTQFDRQLLKLQSTSGPFICTTHFCVRSQFFGAIALLTYFIFFINTDHVWSKMDFRLSFCSWA